MAITGVGAAGVLADVDDVARFADRNRFAATSTWLPFAWPIVSGGRIVPGTAIAYSGTGLPAHWGQNAEALGHLVKAGMTPLEAIEAGTAHGPSMLGPQAPRSGQLIKGYDADFIAVSATCGDDVSVLIDPTNITHVWKGRTTRQAAVIGSHLAIPCGRARTVRHAHICRSGNRSRELVAGSPAVRRKWPDRHCRPRTP